MYDKKIIFIKNVINIIKFIFSIDITRRYEPEPHPEATSKLAKLQGQYCGWAILKNIKFKSIINICHTTITNTLIRTYITVV